MLLGILRTSLLENMLTGKNVLKAGKGATRTGQNLKYKNIIIVNLNLTVFIQEIVHQK